MRLCRRPTGSPVAMSIASCGSCASAPWLPSPCAVRLRRPTRVLGASRNERCRLLRGSGKSYQLWCVRRTWTEMPLHTSCRAKNFSPRRLPRSSHVGGGVRATHGSTPCVTTEGRVGSFSRHTQATGCPGRGEPTLDAARARQWPQTQCSSS